MTTTIKNGCDQTERVSEYALRALPASEHAAFQAHLSACRECENELAAMRPIVDALVEWPTDVLRPPAPLWERVAQRIDLESDGAASAVPEERWVGEPEWREVAPGISCKLLAADPVHERVSLLVRLGPGVSYPAHDHAGVEELHLLDGELWIEDRLLHPGDYNRAERGTGDSRVFSETGCTCVLVTSFRDVLR